MKYDLILKGGRLFDPGAGIDRKGDLGISGGKIAALETDIPEADGAKAIDVAGRYVMPGLIDLHTHVYYGVSPFGIDPDPVMARSGATTWVDAGSAGSSNFAGLRRFVMDNARTRIIPYINLSCIGIPSFHSGELENRWNLHGPELMQAVEANRDVIAGVKLRIMANVNLKALFYGKRLAASLGLPIMVHYSDYLITLREVLLSMGPGDVLTHCYTGHGGGMIGPDGHVIPEVRSAMEKGVKLDVGHGCGSFSIDVVRTALDEGIIPDVISTDLHTLSINGPVFDMPTTMSKFLSLGLSLEDVVIKSTTAPAELLGREGELGTLRAGAEADVAVMDLEQGEFEFYDAYGSPFGGTKRLVNTLTVMGGEAMSRD